VLYQSPSILGTQLSVQASLPGNGTNNEIATLVYDRGPLYVACAAQRVKYGLGITPLVQRQNAYFLGASYAMKYVQLYASYTHSVSYDFGAIDTTYHGGFSIPISVSSLGVSWARTKSRIGGTDAKTHRDTAGATYDYPLSKQTDVYLSYLYDKLSDAGSASSMAVGIRHRF
jgi:predicted porin